MNLSAENHEEIRQYLLGNLSPEIQQGIEERLLTEHSFLEELLLAEEELIDDYVNDDLSDDNRLRFEQHFLSTPERHQNLRFALALSRYTSNSPEKADSKSAKAQSSLPPTESSWAERFRAFWRTPTWALRTAAALAVVAIIAGALWFFYLRTPSPQTFATLTLTISGSNRAEGVQASKVPFPLNADALRISLVLPKRIAPASRYRVELENQDGETKPLEIVGQDAQSVSVVIPATQLARGQYALNLFTINADGTEQGVNGSYFFTAQ